MIVWGLEWIAGNSVCIWHGISIRVLGTSSSSPNFRSVGASSQSRRENGEYRQERSANLQQIDRFRGPTGELPESGEFSSASETRHSTTTLNNPPSTRILYSYSTLDYLYTIQMSCIPNI